MKAVELQDKSFVVLYNVEGEIYCSDVNSTAYKFPLANANLIDSEFLTSFQRQAKLVHLS